MYSYLSLERVASVVISVDLRPEFLNAEEGRQLLRRCVDPEHVDRAVGQQFLFSHLHGCVCPVPGPEKTPGQKM
jgi:hypothetical protein